MFFRIQFVLKLQFTRKSLVLKAPIAGFQAIPSTIIYEFQIIFVALISRTTRRWSLIEYSLRRSKTITYTWVFFGGNFLSPQQSLDGAWAYSLSWCGWRAEALLIGPQASDRTTSKLNHRLMTPPHFLPLSTYLAKFQIHQLPDISETQQGLSGHGALDKLLP